VKMWEINDRKGRPKVGGGMPGIGQL